MDENKSVKPVVGIAEYFNINDFNQAGLIIETIKKIGVTELRTVISWADWYARDGEKWYDWLIPELAKNFKLLPCFTYTPPELAVEPKIFAPPKNPGDYARFVDIMIKKYGEYFDAVELWNEPNNLNNWDRRLDPEWNIFSEMITSAAELVKNSGKLAVLGGLFPVDPGWLKLMGEKNVLKNFDIAGIHGFHGTWESDWSDWDAALAGIFNVLKIYKPEMQVWITKAGYSTWKHDEHKQLAEFVKLINAPVGKVYWYSARDLHPDIILNSNSLYDDERYFHFGMTNYDGSPKLLYRLWQEDGLDAVESMTKIQTGLKDNRKQELKLLRTPLNQNRSTGIRQNIRKINNRPVLIFGGAGFMGTNTALKYLSNGKPVRIFDNLSHRGVEKNLQFLLRNYKDLVDIEIGDIRDSIAVKNIVRDVKQIYNFASPSGAASSFENPVTDFEINVKGTLNVLEAVRNLPDPVPVFYTSTSLVYGSLDDIIVKHNALRYYPENEKIKKNGIDERRPLDFRSPYGCSKGSADQYVIDYSRSYNIPAVVFRLNSIYGPYQHGSALQGWISYFLIQALDGKPVTVFGDGKQVRDILFIDDLVSAFFYANDNLEKVSGQAFNIGGGPLMTISPLELIREIETIAGKKMTINFEDWHQGDQKYFVSSINKFSNLTGWIPKIKIREGIERLYNLLILDRTDKPVKNNIYLKDFRRQNRVVHY